MNPSQGMAVEKRGRCCENGTCAHTNTQDSGGGARVKALSTKRGACVCSQAQRRGGGVELRRN